MNIFFVTCVVYFPAFLNTRSEYEPISLIHHWAAAVVYRPGTLWACSLLPVRSSWWQIFIALSMNVPLSYHTRHMPTLSRSLSVLRRSRKPGNLAFFKHMIYESNWSIRENRPEKLRIKNLSPLFPEVHLLLVLDVFPWPKMNKIWPLNAKAIVVCCYMTTLCFFCIFVKIGIFKN